MGNVLKYDKELYTDCMMYSDDSMSEIERYEDKIVKCRKSHICYACQKEISKGDYALREHGFMDNKPVSAYTCTACVEQWLEESGQVGINECNV